MLVVLYGGDERINSVMSLCAGLGAKLVRGESVVKLSVYCHGRARRRPSKSLAKVSLRYTPL